jgi:hypothetical protein
MARRIPLSPRAGRGRIASAIRVRGRIRKRGGDDLHYAVRICEHFIVPKPNDAIAVIAKPAIAQYVTRVIRVLPAIDLNHEPSLPAREIDHVRTNRKLPNEFVTERTGTKMIPKLQLSLRRIEPKIARAFSFAVIGFTHEVTPPHPAAYGGRPLPVNGER